MFQCSFCGLKFDEEKRLKIHFKTHENKETKNKKQVRKAAPDFEKPDFSQVM
jgi:rubredoxin